MEITCQKCQSRFKISDDKVPPGRTFSMKCPKCQGKIQIDGSAESDPSAQSANLKGVVHDVDASAYDASEKPFDYIRAGMKAALVCEHDQEVKKKIRQVLEHMDYHVVEAATARLALKYMRFHVYHLVVLNETFEAASAELNYVLQYLSQLPMDVRRNIFVVLLGSGLKTMDNMTAFNKSVNLVLNVQEIGDMESLLQGALAEHEEFYQVFKELIKTTR
ncbi:MAG: zinc-ribbon domain-containing protein [Thermodesulfobacteriota bacterium]|nr:zinc-ribbon domain-containing protein [Thermodesulfobacteriota bacterium]